MVIRFVCCYGCRYYDVGYKESEVDRFYVWGGFLNKINIK